MYLHRSFSNRRAYLNTIEARQPGAHHDDENGVGPSGTRHSDNGNDGNDGDEDRDAEDDRDLTKEDDEDEFTDSDDDNGD